MLNRVKADSHIARAVKFIRETQVKDFGRRGSGTGLSQISSAEMEISANEGDKDSSKHSPGCQLSSLMNGSVFSLSGVKIGPFCFFCFYAQCVQRQECRAYRRGGPCQLQRKPVGNFRTPHTDTFISNSVQASENGKCEGSAWYDSVQCWSFGQEKFHRKEGEQGWVRQSSGESDREKGSGNCSGWSGPFGTHALNWHGNTATGKEEGPERQSYSACVQCPMEERGGTDSCAILGSRSPVAPKTERAGRINSHGFPLLRIVWCLAASGCFLWPYGKDTPHRSWAFPFTKWRAAPEPTSHRGEEKDVLSLVLFGFLSPCSGRTVQRRLHHKHRGRLWNDIRNQAKGSEEEEVGYVKGRNDHALLVPPVTEVVCNHPFTYERTVHHTLGPQNSAPYTGPSKQCTIHRALRTVHPTLGPQNSAPYTGPSEQCTLHWALRTVHPTLGPQNSAPYTGPSEQCTLHWALRTVHPTLGPQNSAPYTGPSEQCTLHWAFRAEHAIYLAINCLQMAENPPVNSSTTPRPGDALIVLCPCQTANDMHLGARNTALSAIRRQTRSCDEASQHSTTGSEREASLAFIQPLLISECQLMRSTAVIKPQHRLSDGDNGHNSPHAITWVRKCQPEACGYGNGGRGEGERKNEGQRVAESSQTCSQKSTCDPHTNPFSQDFPLQSGRGLSRHSPFPEDYQRETETPDPDKQGPTFSSQSGEMGTEFTLNPDNCFIEKERKSRRQPVWKVVLKHGPTKNLGALKLVLKRIRPAIPPFENIEGQHQRGPQQDLQPLKRAHLPPKKRWKNLFICLYHLVTTEALNMQPTPPSSHLPSQHVPLESVLRDGIFTKPYSIPAGLSSWTTSTSQSSQHQITFGLISEAYTGEALVENLVNLKEWPFCDGKAYSCFTQHHNVSLRLTLKLTAEHTTIQR
ncbi:hypothetical protein JZ751_022965 [Albula glossodonta]|uniref:Uncharacterized protein n=1 Tax=Albula glossodonta TaxID=121402 RepID=A0A8T2PGU3_9TELE|nr:hypothetical protein JZ751_022965 [Albula glossodonta]